MHGPSCTSSRRHRDEVRQRVSTDATVPPQAVVPSFHSPLLNPALEVASHVSTDYQPGNAKVA